MPRSSIPTWAFALALCTLVSSATAQNPDDVQIRSTDLGHGIFMLEGSGGNLALSVGGDASFLVDDQFAPLTEKIVAAVAEHSDRPVDFVLNTHWHGDHTGGNENFGEAGAWIVAHENVRERLRTKQIQHSMGGREIAAQPEGALPVMTFENSVSFHINDLELRALHVEHAHTDGDAIVFFEGANVVHMGDVWFNGLYPFVDWSAGGDIDGIIAACDRVLRLVDEETKIIPGHGVLGGKADLQEYRLIMKTVSDRIHKMLDEGKSVEQIVAAKPSAEWDEALGQTWLTGDQFVEKAARGIMRRVP